MVLVTVGVGFLLGARGSAHPATLSLTLLGTALVAGGASTLNQWMERARDARMRRTANRALPRGRLGAVEAASFGVGLGLAGTAILLWGANWLAAAVAVSTLLLYVLVYTPLKPWTTLNTAIGAIPGALPPVIGWAAATETLGIEAFSLFLIVFLWQFPHFLAIAWIYREDYARGGLKMLPGVDPQGTLTGRQATIYALALIPAGLLPATIGLAGAGLLRRGPGAGPPLPGRGDPVLDRRLGIDRPSPAANVVSLLARWSCFSWCSIRCRPEVFSRRFTLLSGLDPRDSITMADATASPSSTHSATHAGSHSQDHHAPVTPGKVAMWLFLATEVMFFTGLIGSYIVLRSGSPSTYYTNLYAPTTNFKEVERTPTASCCESAGSNPGRRPRKLDPGSRPRT